MKEKQTEFLKLCLADSLIKLMQDNNFDEININEICKIADVGRTTYYRHLSKNNVKEELLIFKLEYEWKNFSDRHNTAENKGLSLLNFIYENKSLILSLNNNNLITIVMLFFETVMEQNKFEGKNEKYVVSFFTYGYFGIIYQWIKSNFSETPKQIEEYFTNAFNSSINK